MSIMNGMTSTRLRLEFGVYYGLNVLYIRISSDTIIFSIVNYLNKISMGKDMVYARIYSFLLYTE